jgi:hypothetical protein
VVVKPKLLSGLSFLIVLVPFAAFAQAPSNSVVNAGVTLAAPSVSEKWAYFQTETIAPLARARSTPPCRRLTQTTPRYGRDLWPAYPQRFGASVADLVSQNFWGDFVVASALHEDTRYRRAGESRKLWPRIGYAISRSLVTRADSGKATFNWSSELGTAISAGLSNAHYPPASRTAAAALANWGTTVAGSGLANLLPEFLPDFKRWLKRHHLF